METTQKFCVKGMMCGHCEATVVKALNQEDGVHEVVADHKHNRVTISFDSRKTGVHAFEQIILDQGYSLGPEPESLAPPPASEKIPPPGQPDPDPSGQKPAVSSREVSFRIHGMSCANCALAIEKALNRAEGIQSAVINLPLEKGFVSYDPDLLDEEKVFRIVQQAGYMAAKQGAPDLESQGKESFRFYFALGLTLPMMAVMYGGFFPMATAHYILCILATLVQFVSGTAFYKGAYFSLKNRTANMDVLISLGISAAYFYSIFSLFFLDPTRPVFFDSSAMIITFILLGKMLEARAKGKTGQALEKLLALNPDRARIIRENGAEEEIPSSLVAKGDKIKILAGERIPVDGVVIQGKTAVDESMITGESLPVDKKEGDRVTGATINLSGAIVAEARKVGKETLLASIVKMVEDAQTDKAPIQRLADTISNVFVPLVVLAALASFGFWYYFGNLPGPDRFLFAFERMIAVLVIACPCALGLATPTAIMVGSGVGLRNGILVKKGSVLENISKLDMILFDKTGTLTQGRPEVTGVYPARGMSETRLVSLAAAAEANSTHPLARSIVDHAKNKKISFLEPRDVKETSGQGIFCTLNGKALRVGKPREEDEMDPELVQTSARLMNQGMTLAHVSLDNRIQGIVALSDPIKPGAKKAISRLHQAGLQTALISGDTKESARYAANQVGIEQIRAQVLPNDKIAFVKQFQAQGFRVGMVGDGINDAPALAQADIGIAIGSGTDVAKETGEVVLIKNSILDVEKAIRLGKKTLSTIKMNFFWAFFYNVLMIPIAGGILYTTFGLTLKPELAGIAMWLSSLTVVGNSLRLNRFKG